MANVEVKQVDVMGLMGALQTKGKARLSDFATPIESENSSSTNNSNQETMAQNVKAADLIGKTIVVGDNQATIVIKSVDGDKLSGEFTKDGKTTPMSFPIGQLQRMTEKGLWKIADANETATEVTTEADVAEVNDIVPVVTPKAKVQDSVPQPADDNEPDPDAIGEIVDAPATVEPVKPVGKQKKSRAKDVKPETKEGAKYVYATYQTKKGKMGAKITGFASEDDVFYAMAAEIHASGSYERDKQGNKHYYLCFGPHYAEAAKSICKELNSDKTVNQKVEVCKLIVSQATEERVQKREEWKAKREERKAERANAESKPKEEKPDKGEKTYTQSELAEWLRKLNAGDPKAAKFFNDLAKAA